MKRPGYDGNGPPVAEISDRTPEDTSEADDALNRDGAMALAKRLQQYWHDRGYKAVRFWAEPIDERFAKVGTYEIYRIVCNLVNGLPPRYRDDPPNRK